MRQAVLWRAREQRSGKGMATVGMCLQRCEEAVQGKQKQLHHGNDEDREWEQREQPADTAAASALGAA